MPTRPAKIYHRFAIGVSYFMEMYDITYTINGVVSEVNRVLGKGFLEKVYENALMVESKQKGLRAESQVPIKTFWPYWELQESES